MIDIVEQAIGKKAKRVLLPMQQGDVPATFADVGKLNRLCGYEPKVPIAVGIPRFVEWYRSYRSKLTRAQ